MQITDSKIYTSKKLDFETVKTATIEAKEGYQIKITSFKETLSNAKAGISTTVLISCECAGKRNDIDSMQVTKSTVRTYNRYPYIGQIGQSVTVKWELKTGNAAYQAQMTAVVVEYEYVPVEVPIEEPEEEPIQEEEPEETDETPSIVVITCSSEAKADELIESLRTLTTDDVFIYKQV